MFYYSEPNTIQLYLLIKPSIKYSLTSSKNRQRALPGTLNTLLLLCAYKPLRGDVDDVAWLMCFQDLEEVRLRVDVLVVDRHDDVAKLNSFVTVGRWVIRSVG